MESHRVSGEQHFHKRGPNGSDKLFSPDQHVLFHISTVSDTLSPRSRPNEPALREPPGAAGAARAGHSHGGVPRRRAAIRRWFVGARAIACSRGLGTGLIVLLSSTFGSIPRIPHARKCLSCYEVYELRASEGPSVLLSRPGREPHVRCRPVADAIHSSARLPARK